MKKTSVSFTAAEVEAIRYAIDCAIGELIQFEDDELENLGFAKFQDLLLDVEYRLGEEMVE
jgi:hypothetical protein